MRGQSITYHDASFPSSPNEKSKAAITTTGTTTDTAASTPDNGTASVLSADMYQQRQRLFDEIAKRKKARKSLKRKSIISNPSRNSVLVVHPLDLSQDPDSYTPPPMPPAEPQKEEASWTRYNEDENAIREDEEALERQKRLNALSAERMEYEMYRSDEVSSTASGSVHIHDDDDEDEGDDAETALVKKSHRKRPKSGRWSQVYADNNVHKPLATLNQFNEEEEEEQEEDDKNEQLMNPESQELLNK